MSERIHVLAQQLFGKPSLSDCSLHEIREVAERYPYFAPAQFLLLEKLKQENDPAYGAQLQKAVLYYHDPLSFEHFINSDRFYTRITTSNKEEPQASPIAVEEGTPEVHNEPAAPVVEEAISEIHPESTDSIVKEPAPVEIVPVIDEASEAHQSGDTVEIPEAGSEAVVNSSDAGVDTAPMKPSETSAAIEPVTVAHESATAAGAPATAPDDSHAPPQIAPPPITVAPAAEPLAFEPFHTVDYFASQGIKLSQEEVGQDKFGKQLRSFTDWLRTMKRLPQQAPPAPIDSSTEQNVQHLAADSVHETNIVTEAMAEVWLKQGNTTRAADIYRKLSLLNPSKRAYFAAKIDQLKSS